MFCSEPVVEDDILSGCDVLLLGLEGAGKTLLVKRLQGFHEQQKLHEFSADVVPSIGVELYEIAAVPKSTQRSSSVKRIVVREVGGQMLPLWPQYFNDCRSVMFVLDAGDPNNLAEAIVELYELVKNSSLQGKPFCLVLNKHDLPVTFTRVELDMMAKLTELDAAMPGRLTVLQASAFNGQGTEPILNWLITQKAAAAEAVRRARLERPS